MLFIEWCELIVTVKLRAKNNGCIQIMETIWSAAAEGNNNIIFIQTANTFTKMDWEKREKCLTWILIMFSNEPLLQNGNHFLYLSIQTSGLWEFYMHTYTLCCCVNLCHAKALFFILISFLLSSFSRRSPDEYLFAQIIQLSFIS